MNDIIKFVTKCYETVLETAAWYIPHLMGHTSDGWKGGSRLDMNSSELTSILRGDKKMDYVQWIDATEKFKDVLLPGAKCFQMISGCPGFISAIPIEECSSRDGVVGIEKGENGEEIYSLYTYCEKNVFVNTMSVICAQDEAFKGDWGIVTVHPGDPLGANNVTGHFRHGQSVEIKDMIKYGFKTVKFFDLCPGDVMNAAKKNIGLGETRMPNGEEFTRWEREQERIRGLYLDAADKAAFQKEFFGREVDQKILGPNIVR